MKYQRPTQFEITADSLSLNNTVVIYNNEQRTYSLVDASYPDSGRYKIRLVESSPRRGLLAESIAFFPPGVGMQSSSASTSSPISTTSFGAITISATAVTSSLFSNYSSSYSPSKSTLPSVAASSFNPISTAGQSSGSVGGPPLAAIIGGVLGALLTLILSLLIYLCRRKRIKFQRLKRQDSLSGNPTAMYSHPSSSAFFKSYSSQSRSHQISTESPSDPFSGGVLYSSRDDSGSALASSSTSTNPAILEELNSLRAKIKDLERLQQSMPEAPTDVKNRSTPLFLSYQHSGTESLPHYDSVNDTHNLFGHQSHVPGSTKTQCFCSSCNSV
uniref:Uncharacterized protein n=1 Tax=Psilocybe cubensis TaxID=181762 RepID=A0A8H7XLN8_PSICU